MNGTALDIKVNPYTINLGKKENGLVLDTESVEAIVPNDSISKDVAIMWFYPKAEPQLS